MGILDRNRTHGNERAGNTVVAAGTKLVGDLTLSDHLHIDGHIEGTIRSESEIAIGEQGRVEGEIEAERLYVSGSFEGSISARRLEIVAGGRVEGDVVVSELVIEPGGQFNGNSRIREQEAGSPRQLAHESKAAKPADKAEKDDQTATVSG